MDEVTLHLAQLCAVIRQQASGQDADLAALPRNALSRRLLGLIRAAFVERAAALPAPDAGQLLRLLGALEQVGQRLEAEWSQHFSDRLSGPDGLELVVEVAHDLRSPLTSILFLAETLQRARSGAVNPVQERQLGLIYSAAFGLSSVASDVIELARRRPLSTSTRSVSVPDILESGRTSPPIARRKRPRGPLTPRADFRIGSRGSVASAHLTPRPQFTPRFRRVIAKRPVPPRSSSRSAIPAAAFAAELATLYERSSAVRSCGMPLGSGWLRSAVAVEAWLDLSSTPRRLRNPVHFVLTFPWRRGQFG